LGGRAAAENKYLVHAFFADTDELLGERFVSAFLHHYPEFHCYCIPSGHHLSEKGAIIEHLRND
jgi:hypothetical protein